MQHAKNTTALTQSPPVAKPLDRALAQIEKTYGKGWIMPEDASPHLPESGRLPELGSFGIEAWGASLKCSGQNPVARPRSFDHCGRSPEGWRCGGVH